MTNKKSTTPDTAMTYFLPSDDPNMFATIFMEPPTLRGNAGQSTDQSAPSSMTHKRVLVAPQKFLMAANRRRNPPRQFCQRMNSASATLLQVALEVQRMEARGLRPGHI